MSKISEALKKSALEQAHKSPKLPKRALGRGLAALIGEKGAQTYKKQVPIFSSISSTTEGGILYLEIDKVSSGKLQPRENFDGNKLKELVASVKEKGVLQPILVRKSNSGFEIIAGERRFRASQALGLKKIPAIVKDVEDKDALIISLMENIQRQELNPIEEAHAFQQLLDEFHVNQDEIARALGKDKTTISNILRLLKLPKDIQAHIARGDITAGHAKVLLGVDDASKQRKLCKVVISNSLSVRGLEHLISSRAFKKGKRHAPAKMSDPYVLNVERQLQLALGTKIRIMPQGKRGKIIIEYYSPEDLERIVKVIKSK